MAENSAIEWTDATFNPWIGCTKVSPACDHCYAETLSKARLGVPWGAGQPRRRTSVQNWNLPLRWNRKAEKEGRRMRVFCASLADVFDAEVSDEWRNDLFDLIDRAPNLDWLLLTKRPAVARKVMPATPRPNVWLGTTVESQAMAETRIPHLLATPAAVRFLSMEPLLGPVDLTRVVISEGPAEFYGHPNITKARFTVNALAGVQSFGWRSLDWVIVGGESGPKARPMHPDWARSLRDQCAAADVPFLFKQWGEWAPMDAARIVKDIPIPPRGGIHGDWVKRYVVFADDAGAVRVQAEPFSALDNTLMYRVGKKAAGRYLDGVLHDALPAVR
ncbi:phage Gp37/Gp68 family protein (plasmid) [Azospirillum baldaniorum]|uniref:Gp37 n=1 Tax=Azospirillum baldaniorum TaxID=1064539 RepID=A0A9P1JU30_9PROT|nr:phage Gp37/Gp68 family protein [Azospirillum baldaniorum]AWJ91448.1 phage Gp37/Gp68 family protein [Azospirillum baldaniorum]TWA83696.1 protein gp37 [Azospirillum brasilense]CCC99741.1 Gp37 [Azospirillum baldaniorum]